MSRFFIGALLAALFILSPERSQADEVKVAAAANFSLALKELQKEFEKKTGHKLLASFGSSGAVYAQIRNGAPFDIFLSADSERPERLEQEKLIVPGSRFSYAIGKLVLWSPTPGVVDQDGAILKHGVFKKLALADPRTAPYGAAAKETLQKLKLHGALASRLVQGVDIGQAYQFVASGAAELGFVAYSQILVKSQAQGSFWVVPQKLYTPIRQQAVLLTRARENKAAQAFLDFLKSKEAKAVIQAYGYEVR